MSVLRGALGWLLRSRLLLLLWTLDLVLLAVLVADVFQPVPNNASETTKRLREAALPLFGSGLSVLVVFTLQTTRTRLERRHEALRRGCSLLLAAVQTMLELQRELKYFPKGHITSPPGVMPVELGDFQRANELDDEWRRLYREGEREVILEEGPEGPTFAAWRTVRDSYWGWSAANRDGGTAATLVKLDQLETAFTDNAKTFSSRCREALRRLA